MEEIKRFFRENEAYIIGALIFLAAFQIYLKTVNPTIAFEDSGEFITLSYTLGLSHPPGYPLYMPIGKLFSLFPVGEIAFRINLMSSFFGAMIGVLMYFILMNLFELTGVDVANRFVAATAGLLLTYSDYVWSLSIIDEVYTANTFFFCLEILLLLLWEKRRRSLGDIDSSRFNIEHLGILCAFSLYYGLHIGIHQSMILMAPPFVLFILLMDHKTLVHNYRTLLKLMGVFVVMFLMLAFGVSLRVVLLTAIFLMLGLSYEKILELAKSSVLLTVMLGFSVAGAFVVGDTLLAGLFLLFMVLFFDLRNFMVLFFFMFLGVSIYLYTPLRAISGPCINWGKPIDLEFFLEVFNRAQYGSLDSAGKSATFFSELLNLVPVVGRVNIKYWRHLFDQFAFFDMVGQFNPAAFMLALYGIYRLFIVNIKHFIFILFMFVMATLGYLLIVDPPLPQQIPLLLKTFFLPISMTLAIFIGFGLSGLLENAKLLLGENKKALSAIAATLGVLLLSWSIRKHYDSHDDSRHYFSFDYATNMLRTLPKKSMLFTYLAQDTFPLWYNKYVRGLRQDVVIVHQRLLALPWHSSQIEQNNPGFKIPYGGYLLDSNKAVPLMEIANASSRFAIAKNPSHKLYFSNFNQPFTSHGYTTTPSGLLFARYNDPYGGIINDKRALDNEKKKLDGLNKNDPAVQKQLAAFKDRTWTFRNSKMQAEKEQRWFTDKIKNYRYRGYSDPEIHKDGRIREFQNIMSLVNLRASAKIMKYLRDQESAMYYGHEALRLAEPENTRKAIADLQRSGVDRLQDKFLQQRIILYTNSLKNIGSIYRESKLYAKALPYLEEAVEVDTFLGKVLNLKSNKKTQGMRKIISSMKKQM